MFFNNFNNDNETSESVGKKYCCFVIEIYYAVIQLMQVLQKF